MYESALIPEKGGTERITDLIMKGLESRGYNCMAMLELHKDGSIHYQGNHIADLYKFLIDHNVDVVINQMAYQTWLIDSFLNHGGRKWRNEGGKIISCLHFDPEQPSYLSLIMSKREKTVNDYWQIVKHSLLWPIYNRRHEMTTAAVYNHIYDCSDFFVLLSDSHLPYIKRILHREDYSRLTVINNPLTFPDISAPEILNQKKHQVLIVARMDEYYKRISLALKAWKLIQKKNQEHRDWQLIVIGDGPSLQDYKQYVKKQMLSNVIFMGQQSPEPYYRYASIFIMTSSKEGWGLTLTESLQRGVVPILMDSCPVFHDIIIDGDNGCYVKDGDVTAMADKIFALMNNADLLREYQQRALISASHFDINNIIDKWIKII